jgi:hypothetical protein
MLDKAAHSILLDQPLETYKYIKDFIIRVEDFDGGANNQRLVTVGTCPVPNDFDRNVNNDDSSSSLSSSSKESWSTPSPPVKVLHSHRHSHRWRYSYNDANGIQGQTGRPYFGVAAAGRFEWILSLLVTMVLSFLMGKKVGMRHRERKTSHCGSLSSLRSEMNNAGGGYQAIPVASLDASEAG